MVEQSSCITIIWTHENKKKLVSYLNCQPITEVLQFPLHSLSTTHFFPMTNHLTNHLELWVVSHHTTAQKQAKYPDICFHNFHSKKINKVMSTSSHHCFPSGTFLISNSSCHHFKCWVQVSNQGRHRATCYIWMDSCYGQYHVIIEVT